MVRRTCGSRRAIESNVLVFTRRSAQFCFRLMSPGYRTRWLGPFIDPNVGVGSYPVNSLQCFRCALPKESVRGSGKRLWVLSLRQQVVHRRADRCSPYPDRKVFCVACACIAVSHAWTTVPIIPDRTFDQGNFPALPGASAFANAAAAGSTLFIPLLAAAASSASPCKSDCVPSGMMFGCAAPSIAARDR
jgi:hypothetical protein